MSDVHLFLLFGMFCFSEGKTCPEKTRDHKSCCDVYYKCTELSATTYVWIPVFCEQGLIYEHKLHGCVVPENDWECLKESNNYQRSAFGKNYNKNNKRESDVYVIGKYLEADDADNDFIFIDENNKDDETKIVFEQSLNREDDNYEGSGNDNEKLMQLDNVMQMKNLENSKVIKNQTIIKNLEEKETMEDTNNKSNVDHNLIMYLQRLSQLVDGLKGTYQNTNPQREELRPDQLNAFLAHFNLKNQFNALSSSSNHLSSPQTVVWFNRTQDKEKLKYLKPIKKLVIHNNALKNYISYDHLNGYDEPYAGTHIIGKRPENVLMFASPYQAIEQQFIEYSDNTPKISEETLKTVLELSKQMIANQDIPKVVSYPNYFNPSLMQPAAFTSQKGDSPFSSNYYHSILPSGNNQAPISKSESVFSSTTRPNNNGYNGYNRKPPTTIIHNNVIPIQVSGTDSNEKHSVDSYGHDLYPPFLNYMANMQPNLNKQKYENNDYSVSSTQAPFISSSYATTAKPFDFLNTPAALTKYFIPSQHLNNENINTHLQITDNYGNMPRPQKIKQQHFHSSFPASIHQNIHNTKPNFSDDYINNSLFPADINPQNVLIQPNSQKSDSNEMDNEPLQENFNEQMPLIMFSYGKRKPVHSSLQENHTPQTDLDSVFSSSKMPYMPRPSSNPMPSYHKIQSNHLSSNLPDFQDDGTQLVNVGGNFIGFNVFKKSILPLMEQDTLSLNQIEIINCVSTVRQPNSTDCSRYYVCSKKDSKVLSYSCPPYTAFNKETRICDKQTYTKCKTEFTSIDSYLVNEKERMQLEALKAWKEGKYKQYQQDVKTPNLANGYQLHFNYPLSSTTSSTFISDNNTEESYIHNPTIINKPNDSDAHIKKHKYYCKEGDKIADKSSITNYFVCFKNSQGQMKGHKMTCTKGLIFCANSSMCTLATKCL
uniref:Chitin-binding type-2 domain-containing protein n=1 Tax=Glossina brevipalpis TaxID=37001 RepID=A0A1A9WKI5_9MUSC